MTCEEARLRISWWIDGELDESGLRELQEHLAACERCAAVHGEYAANDDRLREALGKVGPSKGFRSRVVTQSRKRKPRPWLRRLAMAAAGLFAVLGAAWAYVNTMAAPLLVVQVHGGGSFHADSMGALRVFVTNASSGLPVAGAAVRVFLANSEVGSFTTSAAGSIDGSFKVPDVKDGSYPLRIEVDSSVGEDTLVRNVKVRREYRLLLTTDKPMYQPGQTIHLRAMALNSFTLKPRPGDARFEVMDSKGNRIFRKGVKLSDYGIGSIDFELADEVNLGTYRVAIHASGLTQERTVEVAKYVLPKFKVELELQKRSYRPREVVRGTLKAKYFFGKPVQGAARVRIGREVVSGTLDKDGTWEFQAPAQGSGNVKVTATVTDTADHVESKSTIAIVSDHPLKVTLVPEGGEITYGVENEFYVIVSTPDGRPTKAQVSLTVNGKPLDVATDDLGVARFRAGKPYTIQLREARDEAGNETSTMKTLSPVGRNDFLIRLDKPAYKGGETMTVQILRARPGPIYVDVVKGGQLILAKAVTGETLAIDLPPDLFGTVQVVAYRRNTEKPVVRVAYVNLPEGLRIRPHVAKDTFRPGEEMPVEFEVVDREGKPVQAALGIAVVDQALFGLVESKLASEKAWLSLAPELINTRGFLKADANSIYQSANLGAQAFVAGNGAAERLPKIAENSWKMRAAEVERFVASYNESMFGLLKVLGIVAIFLAIGVSVWGLTLIVRAMNPGVKNGLLVVFIVVLFMLGMIVLFSPAVERAVPFAGDVSSAPPVAFAKAERAPERSTVSRPRSMPALAKRVPQLKPAPMPPVTPNPPMRMKPATRPAPSEAMIYDESRDRRREEAPPARIRSYFPETLFWMPELITDERGRAKLTLPAADSITSWRLLANAISKGGALGYRNVDLRVFQEFFADIDFPVALTKGDRVHVPVAVYNYLKEAQTVTVRVQEESWFELMDEASKEIALKPDEVSVVYFGLKVKEHGRKSLTVFADGKVKDALRRSVEVMEKGREIPVSISDRVNGTRAFRVTIPDRAIEGTSVLFVRVSPGVSDLVTGLEGMIRLPGG